MYRTSENQKLGCGIEKWDSPSQRPPTAGAAIAAATSCGNTRGALRNIMHKRNQSVLEAVS